MSNYYSFKSKKVEVYTNETNFVYVKNEDKDLFIIYFEAINKPVTYYEHNKLVKNVSRGISCKIHLNKIEFEASVFTDSRDTFEPEVGCFRSFKKVYPSLVNYLIKHNLVSNKEANNIFNVIRQVIDNYPIPVFKPNVFYA